jgi:hypothetical protein
VRLAAQASVDRRPTSLKVELLASIACSGCGVPTDCADTRLHTGSLSLLSLDACRFVTSEVMMLVSVVSGKKAEAVDYY